MSDDAPTSPPDKQALEQERIPWEGAAPVWQPGQSGNPKGRPKRKPFADIVRGVMGEKITVSDGTAHTTEVLLLRKCVKFLLDPKSKIKPLEWCALWRELMNRYVGLPFQAIQEGGESSEDEFQEHLRWAWESWSGNREDVDKTQTDDKTHDDEEGDE